MPGTHSVKFLRSSNERAGITHAAQTGLVPSTAGTFEAWIKATSLVGNADRYSIASKFGNATDRSYWWYFGEDGSNEYRVNAFVSETGLGTGNELSAYSMPGLLQPSAGFIHYACVIDLALSMPDKLKFYIMGELLPLQYINYDTSPASFFSGGSEDFEVGANSATGSNYSSNMQVDELRVWNVARTQAQIRTLMNVQAVGDESGLQGCWHFDNDYVDATANGNDLTPVNTPTFVSGDVGGLPYHNGIQIGQLAAEYSSPVNANDGTLIGTGAGGDTTAPVISNLTPAAGPLAADKATAEQTPIEFDVTDTAPGLRMVVVHCKYDGDPKKHVVHDGTSFVWPFNSATSARTAITDGYHYTVLPATGWRMGIEDLFVYAVDQAGNLEGALP